LALHEFECSWSHIDAVESSAVDAAAFTAQYDDRSRPVLLRSGAAQWQAFKRYGPDSGPGGMHRFCLDHAELRMRLSHSFHAAGSLRCSLRDYSRYCLCQHDEVPLYVFDAKFVTTHEPLRSLYDIPAQFTHDMFSLIGSARPSYRWIVMGPARCGAPWHVDPIGTPHPYMNTAFAYSMTRVPQAQALGTALCAAASAGQCILPATYRQG